MKSFFISLIDICIRGGPEVSEITGVTKAKADGWVFNAQKILEDNDMIRKSDMDIIELMEYQENLETIPTKCNSISLKIFFKSLNLPEAS